MPANTYTLYQNNNVSIPIPVKKPDAASWRRAALDDFGDGAARVSPYVTVQWQYHTLDPSEYLKFETYQRPGLQTFETWMPPSGATGAGFVMARGVLGLAIGGTYVSGEFVNVMVTWTKVRIL
jgi:hypothetical protein